MADMEDLNPRFSVKGSSESYNLYSVDPESTNRNSTVEKSSLRTGWNEYTLLAYRVLGFRGTFSCFVVDLLQCFLLRYASIVPHEVPIVVKTQSFRENENVISFRQNQLGFVAICDDKHG